MTRHRSALDEILDAQRDWAEKAGKPVNAKGYVDSPDSNLFQPLSKTIRESLLTGAGSELEGKEGAAPKFTALHSSSALAINVFAYWETRDSRPLTEALGIEPAWGPPGFEKKFETGLHGTPPHLDVVLPMSDGRIFAIESKFSEWLGRKSKTKMPFREAYFSQETKRWESLGLPECQQLARDIQDRREVFEHLDAPQLLKHALGLANRIRDGFSLGYMYFDWDCDEGEIHRREIERFNCRVEADICFLPLSYQKLFERMTQTSKSEHAEYLAYLRERYFSELLQLNDSAFSGNEA
jgi:hypothetical protein